LPTLSLDFVLAADVIQHPGQCCQVFVAGSRIEIEVRRAGVASGSSCATKVRALRRSRLTGLFEKFYSRRRRRTGGRWHRLGLAIARGFRRGFRRTIKADTRTDRSGAESP